MSASLHVPGCRCPRCGTLPMARRGGSAVVLVATAERRPGCRAGLAPARPERRAYRCRAGRGGQGAAGKRVGAARLRRFPPRPGRSLKLADEDSIFVRRSSGGGCLSARGVWSLPEKLPLGSGARRCRPWRRLGGRNPPTLAGSKRRNQRHARLLYRHRDVGDLHEGGRTVSDVGKGRHCTRHEGNADEILSGQATRY